MRAQVESGPAMTASPPQQMPASGVARLYPTTSAPPPTLSGDPSLSYPTTNPSPYSVADPSPYPSSAPLDSSIASLGQTPSEPAPLYKPYGNPDAMTASMSVLPNSHDSLLFNTNEPYQWQVLPAGLMYKSYLAGNRESRLGSQIVHERNVGWIWDATVGGRVGILRYGTDNELWPQGWQLDIEGAAFPRLDLEHLEDLVSADFRGGLLSTTRRGPVETKFGYYHLSSHLGDEYLIRYPSALATRINYSRDSLIAGVAFYLNPSLRLYSEAAWAFHQDGGAEPWEFQFGLDYSANEPTGILGAPFFAINSHLRQENDFSGNMTVQTGWQWRGRNGHLLRTGMQYFNGMSEQYQFYRTFEEQIGFGLWYDY